MPSGGLAGVWGAGTLERHADEVGAARDPGGEFTHGDLSAADVGEAGERLVEDGLREAFDEEEARALADVDDDLGEAAVIDGVAEGV